MNKDSGESRWVAESGAGNLRLLAAMRGLAIAGQIAAIAAARPLFDIDLPMAKMLLIVALLGLFSLLTLAPLTRSARRVADWYVFGQLCVDVAVLTALLFLSGGASNPFVSLFLPSLAIAAVVLPGRYAWTLAGLCVAAYSMLMFENVPLEIADGERAASLHLAGMWVIFVASAALITWFVARMAATIRSRDLALAAAREEALRNERVIALGSLAAGAAHELGTPLATIAVLVGELADDPVATPGMKTDLVLVREQIEHCKSIITGLAERAGQARAEGGGAIALDQWIEQVVARWRTLRPHADASLDLAGSLPAPRIVGETTLEQALLNLFNNAADACLKGVEIEARWDAQLLTIEVRDRGPGFDEKVLIAPARAFVTTRPEGGGIGLFLAHAVIERFGGQLRLSNRDGGGAVTRVELPLVWLIAGPA